MPQDQPLFDSHCHLDAAEFDSDREAVIERARRANVRFQLLPAVTAASWPKLKAICGANPGLHAAYGLHPMFMNEHLPAHLSELRGWLLENPAAAVGECGLDFFIEDPDRERQLLFFEAQIRLAGELNRPLVIHARKSVEDVILLLKKHHAHRGVIHSYSGSLSQAETLFSMGFYIGIGAVIGFDSAKRLRSLVAHMPLERLLLETDAPDQPGPRRPGVRNEPAFLLEVADEIAQLRNQSPQLIIEQTTHNACALFGVSPTAQA